MRSGIGGSSDYRIARQMKYMHRARLQIHEAKKDLRVNAKAKAGIPSKTAKIYGQSLSLASFETLEILEELPNSPRGWNISCDATSGIPISVIIWTVSLHRRIININRKWLYRNCALGDVPISPNPSFKISTGVAARVFI
jgi:hypothetical protein